VTHTFSPEEDRRIEAVSGATLLAAAVAAVIVFFPADGRVMAPMHDTFDLLLGRVAFIVPLGLALAGGLGLARRTRPDLSLPRRRLAGLTLITLALLPGDHLLGGSTGVIGEWFTRFMIDLVGPPLTALLVIGLVSAGVVLTFDVRKPAVAAR
jgi:hypothetical protein